MKKDITSYGPTKLNGTIQVAGSKNASLPIVAACLLFNSHVELKNLARLKDLSVLLSLLASLNVHLTFNTHSVTLDIRNAHNNEVNQQKAGLIRGSVLILGPLLARFHKVVLPMPGGCKIGKRPIDLHLSAMEKLGATIHYEDNKVIASAPNGLKAGYINFRLPSVTATENALMAASLAPGISILENASTDCEVLELVRFLNEAGIKIERDGSTFKVYGQAEPIEKDITFTIMSDRMEVGTWIAAAGITRSMIKVHHTGLQQLDTVMAHAEKVGIKMSNKEDILTIDGSGPLKAVSFVTGFEPGFPTDLQAPFAALNIVSVGSWSIHETIWENRFDHIKQFQNFGVKNLVVQHDKCEYSNDEPATLNGATVYGKDLRGTCSLLLLSLAAYGKTLLVDSHHIERGYQYFIEKLNILGANIQQYPKFGNYKKLDSSVKLSSNAVNNT